MSRVIVYFAHPGHKHSRANRAMAVTARAIDGITFVDLYSEYPRFNIDIELEQRRLLEHDVIVFQFPMFWYSTPALVKEWEDLVLEHGFAYGAGGDKLAGKRLLLAITAAGPVDAYQPDGYQRHPIRAFLTPLEQTATLCQMKFLPPYVLFSSLSAPTDGSLDTHVANYRTLLESMRDDRFDFAAVAGRDVIRGSELPIKGVT